MSTLPRYDIEGGDDAGIFPEESSDGVWCYAAEALTQIAELTAELARLNAAPVQQVSVPDGYVLACKKSLGTVLQALVNAPHHIRELQATRHPVEVFSDNPINVLIVNYESPAALRLEASDE